MAAGIVIVGAGQAGGRAALTLRELGYDGPLTLIGAEAAAPYERPPLSKAFLTGEAGTPTFVATPERLRELAIDFRPSSRVASINRQAKSVVLSNGERIPYLKLLLATGREPRRLALASAAADRVHYLRDLDDARALQQGLRPGRHVTVIGGGFIGLEVASSAVALGCGATVVELAPCLLARAVPATLAAIIETRHRAEGVDILLGAEIEAITEREGRLEVALAGGRTIATDLVLVGIGAIPRTEFAEAAGLAVDRGIVVDERLATSDPDIFAAGDVTAFPHALGGERMRLESWHNAEIQGPLAARGMLGLPPAEPAVPWFWTDQYDLTLQIAGHPERGTRIVERPLPDGARLLFHFDGGGLLVGVSGIGPSAIGREIRLGQMMLERRLSPAPALLADPAQKLKSLLK